MITEDEAGLTRYVSGRRVHVRPGDRVLFIGDSVTDSGRTVTGADPLGDGYVRLIADALVERSIDARVINQGISGNRTGDLAQRWTTDCVDLAPDVLTIFVGINDTWRRYDSGLPTTAQEFEATYRSLLDATAAATSAQVVLITPFLLPVQPGQADWFEDLAPKIAVVNRLAAEYGATLVSADALMTQVGGSSPERLAGDGVHPTAEGNRLLADAWLATIDGTE
ncbi:SGNH/GDSL hydrolase family protein [Rugosimonospora africana]|uniref:Lysophospholipase n=1 Tax=Rugosimonospora africana TaxID=556532 RepID=A0A8J3VUY9_9ACTN|nr:SGNH/GDSL hydrolase family protein [Rugosimonospora africana]GIH19374.1 lysophospholipase [Rugosimonospora africana]